ncbi:MAG: hypothetical protein ABIE74_01015 [Pseudomonadota bacterium]
MLLESPGGLLTAEKNRWQMGVWQASDRTLIFSKERIVLWSYSYKSMNNLEYNERPFAFTIKRTLQMQCTNEGKSQKVWLVVNDLATWERLIRIRAFPEQLTEERLCKIADKLDSMSEQLLWYLWERRYATVEELTARGNSDDSMNILKIIKEIINPITEELVGYPLLVFRGKNVDPLTNKEIKNSWWIFNPVSDL